MVKQLCFSCMWPTKMTGTNRCHKTRSFRVNLQVTVFRAQLDRPQSQFWFVPQELWILQPLSISLLMQIALFHPGLTINWDLLILAAINTNALVPKSESASEITVASWNPIFLSSSRLLELPKGKKLPYWTQRQDKSEAGDAIAEASALEADCFQGDCLFILLGTFVRSPTAVCLFCDRCQPLFLNPLNPH